MLFTEPLSCDGKRINSWRRMRHPFMQSTTPSASTTGDLALLAHLSVFRAFAKSGVSVSRLVLATLICVLHTSAARESDSWQRCRGADPDARIVGCSEILARGKRETRRYQVEAYENRSSAHRAKGDIDRAIGDLDKALRLNPKSSRALTERASLYYAKGDLDRAIADYGKALLLDRNLALAYEGRAKAYRGKGELDKALADLGEAIARDPASASLRLDRAGIHETKGDLDQALEDYSQAIKSDPKFAAAHNNRGLVFVTKGDFDRALADFSAAIKLDPGFADTLLNRAKIYRAKGDLEHARQGIEAALQLNPQLTSVKEALDEVNKLIAESPPPTPAVEAAKTPPPLIGHWVGITALAIFIAAYVLVMTEELTHLRKSKPVVVAAGLMWTIIAVVYAGLGFSQQVENSLRHVLLEYAELLLFLLVAMAYVNALEERHVFDVLRAWLVRSGFGYRTLFWLTGLLAFFISPLGRQSNDRTCHVRRGHGGRRRRTTFRGGFFYQCGCCRQCGRRF
jgi:tetratricopeptide (TPR) repeat protein